MIGLYYKNSWSVEEIHLILLQVICYLYLTGSNIESLGNLQSVGGNLDLNSTKIESLGNLQSVGGNLYLNRTPLSKITTEKEIRNQVEVGGGIYL